MRKTVREIKIGTRIIGEGRPVFVVAEAGINHNGDMRLAKRMIDAAKAAGADAVKFQSYKTERIITKSAPSAEYHKRTAARDESWYSLLKRIELGDAETQMLCEYCRRRGIEFLSTPYDEKSASLLHALGLGAFKISSTDMDNLPLLEHIARFGKPIILSTGMSTLDEVRQSVEFIVRKGGDKIVLMQCTSNYPPKPEDINLNVLDTLKSEFGLPVGYSDHLASPKAAIAAVAKGACVYEVHFTIDRNLSGPDQKSSLEPDELKSIVSDIRFTEKLLGTSRKEVTGSETETRTRLRKKVVASRPLRLGERITKDMLAIKRAASGIPAKDYYDILGKTIKRGVRQDEPVTLKDLRG